MSKTVIINIIGEVASLIDKEIITVVSDKKKKNLLSDEKALRDLKALDVPLGAWSSLEPRQGNRSEAAPSC